MLLHLRRTSKLSLRLFSTTFPAPSTPSTVAVETRYTHLPSSSQTLSSVIAPIFSTNTSDTKQAFQSVKRKYIEKYQNHKLDVGSSQIQVAILTEKIRLLAAHLQEHKKDKSAFRGFNVCLLPSDVRLISSPAFFLTDFDLQKKTYDVAFKEN